MEQLVTDQMASKHHRFTIEVSKFKTPLANRRTRGPYEPFIPPCNHYRCWFYTILFLKFFHLRNSTAFFDIAAWLNVIVRYYICCIINFYISISVFKATFDLYLYHYHYRHSFYFKTALTKWNIQKARYKKQD